MGKQVLEVENTPVPPEIDLIQAIKAELNEIRRGLDELKREAMAHG